MNVALKILELTDPCVKVISDANTPVFIVSFIHLSANNVCPKHHSTLEANSMTW